MKGKKIPIDGRKKFKVGRHIAVGFLFDMSTGEQSQSVTQSHWRWSDMERFDDEEEGGTSMCILLGDFVNQFFLRAFTAMLRDMWVTCNTILIALPLTTRTRRVNGDKIQFSNHQKFTMMAL